MIVQTVFALVILQVLCNSVASSNIQSSCCCKDIASKCPAAIPSTTTTTTTKPTTTQAPCNSNNQPVCRACPSRNYSCTDLDVYQLVSMSPYFIQYLLKNSATETYAAQCYTYLYLYNDLYFLFSTNTYKNNSASSYLTFITNSPRGSGRLTLTGLLDLALDSSFIATGDVVGTFCEGSSTTISALTVTQAEGCTPYPDYDPIVAFSSSINPPSSCIEEARNSLQPYLNGGELLALPNNGYITCVADLYGVPTYNAKSLCDNAQVEAVSYPTMLPSSVCTS